MSRALHQRDSLASDRSLDVHISHLRRNKPKRTKRQFDKMQPVSKTYAEHMKVALPYGLK